MAELAGILTLGVVAQWLAWRIKVPAILPLILFGLFVGPVSTFFTPDGGKLIDGDAIFNGELLFSFVSLSVGIILFEGGLTLELKEIRQQAGTVRNLLTLGLFINIIGGALAAHYIMELNLRLSFLFGALISVTGPTVIAPILRNVRPNHNITAILKWEGILIDPLGALMAVLAYGFVAVSAPDKADTILALKNFFLTIAAGSFVGTLSAALLYMIIKRNWAPQYLRNEVALGLVVITFAFANFMRDESGLLAVTAMGLILANAKLEEIKKILSFKEDISLILISLLFILLSSRIEVEQISMLGERSLLLFAVIVLGVRPLNVFLSTIGSGLNIRERLFLAWIGPRGIVSAAVASLFTIDLSQHHQAAMGEGAGLLLPLTFLIIVGTVVLQGSTAKPLARLLGVERKELQGILFVGASEAARKMALHLRRKGYEVILADTSHVSIAEANALGLPTYEGSVLDDDALEKIDLSQMGRVLSMTSNTEVNVLTCKKLRPELGDDHVFRLISKREMEVKNLALPQNVLFGGRADFITLASMMRDKPGIFEIELEGEKHYEALLRKHKDLIPLFLETSDSKLKVVAERPFAVERGDTLIYFRQQPLGQQHMDQEQEQPLVSPADVLE